MRRFSFGGLVLLLCFGLAVLPAAVFAHGSNVLEPGHEKATHSHADHASGDEAAEFDELHEQIEQLEAKLTAHDERIRLTDIIGGIGYIVGITGVVYYYLGTQRKKA